MMDSGLGLENRERNIKTRRTGYMYSESRVNSRRKPWDIRHKIADRDDQQKTRWVYAVKPPNNRPTPKTHACMTSKKSKKGRSSDLSYKRREGRTLAPIHTRLAQNLMAALRNIFLFIRNTYCPNNQPP